MKRPKGFRGKYFSLAAILALNATIALASEGQSVIDAQQQLQSPKEDATSEEKEIALERVAPVMVITNKVKAQKSEVYSASKSLVSPTNTTDNVSIITSEELSQKGISTLSEALNTTSGINTTSSGGMGATKSIFLQGMANKYTLFMIDGVRYNDLNSISGADFSHILTDDIERIEVIKGAQSGVWGADAAAGVINVITKRAKEGNHANAGLEIGSYGHKNANVTLSHKANNLDVLLSIQRMVEDGFTTYAPHGKDIDNYEDDAYRNTTINLKTGYWIDESNRIEAGYHDINALNHYDVYNFLLSGVDPNSLARSDTKERSGYLIYKYFIGNHALEATLSQTNIHKKELDTMFGMEKYHGKVSLIEMKDTWKYGAKDMVVFGGNYQKDGLDYTQVGMDEEDYNSHSKALYLHNTNQFGNLILTQALRYDSFSAFEDKLTGKVGAKYLFSKDVNLYANYGTAYKSPAIFEMINLWGTSNLDLKPENIESFNVGMQYAGFNINLFRNEIKDMISWNSTTFINENIDGKSILKGLEIAYEEQFFDTLLAGVNYTYIDAKDEDGKRLVNRPRYQSTLYTTYMPIKELAIHLNGTYIGSRKDYTTHETGNYFVANTKMTYHVDKNWDIYLKINNLFDRYYQSVYGYASAERSYYLGVQAKF